MAPHMDCTSPHPAKARANYTPTVAWQHPDYIKYLQTAPGARCHPLTCNPGRHCPRRGTDSQADWCLFCRQQSRACRFARIGMILLRRSSSSPLYQYKRSFQEGRRAFLSGAAVAAALEVPKPRARPPPRFDAGAYWLLAGKTVVTETKV